MLGFTVVASMNASHHGATVRTAQDSSLADSARELLGKTLSVPLTLRGGHVTRVTFHEYSHSWLAVTVTQLQPPKRAPK